MQNYNTAPPRVGATTKVTTRKKPKPKPGLVRRAMRKGY